MNEFFVSLCPVAKLTSILCKNIEATQRILMCIVADFSVYFLSFILQKKNASA
jgi:hypothetical protein